MDLSNPEKRERKKEKFLELYEKDVINQWR